MSAKRPRRASAANKAAAATNGSSTSDSAVPIGQLDEALLSRYAETGRFRLGFPTQIHPVSNQPMTNDDKQSGTLIDPDCILFLRAVSDHDRDHSLYEYNLHTKQEKLLLSSSDLVGLSGTAEVLTAEQIASRERMRISGKGIVKYIVSPTDPNLLLLPYGSGLYLYSRNDQQLQRLTKSDVDELASAEYCCFSPDGRYIAFTRHCDLYCIDIDTREEWRLTKRDNSDQSNGVASFIAMEEMNRFVGFWWSPDSKQIIYQHNDNKDVEKFYISDPGKPEMPPSSFHYPRTGGKNTVVSLHIVDVNLRKDTKPGHSPDVDVDWNQHNSDTEFPYLNTVVWSKNAHLTIVVQNRKQREQQVHVVDPKDGKTTLIHTENDALFLELEQSVPQWLADGEHFLWMSESSGVRTLVLCKQGSSPTPLHDSSIYFRKLLLVDDARSIIYFQGGSTSDPRDQHLYATKVDLQQKDQLIVRRLTHEQQVATHTFFPNMSACVHEKHTMHHKPQFLIRAVPTTIVAGEDAADAQDHDGHVIADIASHCAFDPSSMDVELTTVSAKSSDGEELTYYCSIVKPANFDSSKKYPVLSYNYGGPHMSHVRYDCMLYTLHTVFASAGFVIVSIDNRGTPNRNRAWERAIYGNMARKAVEDQANGLQQLQQQYSYLDPQRTCFTGWSFGGYLSILVALLRPDAFQCAAAGAPVSDFGGYDTFYTERYMDHPKDNAEGYKDASCLTHANKLSVPLMLIHGTADDNVYFFHSLQMADRLFEANKQFEFITLQSTTHMLADPKKIKHLYTAIVRFFHKSLEKPTHQ